MTQVMLNITAEGETELRFVQNTLAVHLSKFNICVLARKIRTSTGHRGGVTTYEKAKRDIQEWLKQNASFEWKFTTMFDLYKLPKGFPGYEEAAKKNDPYDRIKSLENSFKDDIGDPRFIPYIQLHEFEALIFADPGKLKWEFPDKGKGIQRLIEIAHSCNPELINDHPETAPSKRIITEIASYERNKSNAGPNVVNNIGIDKLKEKCKHFGEWVTKLEHIGI